MATTAQQGSPVVKNLLIKDASGNTQMIEVVQTAPGKFVTASGHAIKAAASPAGGVKTIIRASPGTSQGQQIITSGSPQVIRTSNLVGTSTATVIKQQGGRQMMAIPIQGGQGGLTPILKNIKMEGGGTTQIIQPRTSGSPLVVGNSSMMQVIQAGGQRLLVQTSNGPQFVQATQIGQGGQQYVVAAQQSPGGSSFAGLGSSLNLKQNFISPILDHTGARKRVDFPSDISYESKRRKSEKGGKGLRHFSMKVCEKVRTKGVTTYNEVADELVQEFATPGVGLSAIEQQFDQKNIRRRVYDALNVLMAMNIISKEKKEIRWLGLPTNSMQECTTLEKDRQKRIERLKQKTQQLHDLIIQQVAFKSLVERNKQKEKESGPPPPNGSIHLPFLIVNTAKDTVIDCSISNDKMEYLFNFDGTFEIHDDIEVLKRMGLALGLDKGECTDEDIEKAKSVLPKALGVYVDQIAKRTGDWRSEFDDLDYEEGYYQDGEMGEENGENVCYDMAGNSGLGLSNASDLSGMNMSVEDLEMQAAIQSLHPESAQDLVGEEGDMDEESYGDEEGEDDEGLSE